MSTAPCRPATGRRPLDLPGQQHVADGPLDLDGMYLAHHAFRRDLARFALAARETPVGAADVWAALALRWERFSGILHHHHSTEDAVLWPRLLEVVDARGDAEGRATLEAMAAEHEVIDPVLATCAADLAAMARTPDAVTRERLAAGTATARDTVSDHLGHEERAALPLAQQLLPAESWQRVQEAAGEGTGPAQLPFLVPWIAEGLTPEQLEVAFGSRRRPFRWLLAGTRGRYARREAVAFRYARAGVPRAADPGSRR